MKIIFITRTWHGTGGMQRFSRDFARYLSEEYGDDAIVLHPSARGAVSSAVFAGRALVAGVRYGRGAQVHLGDASLIVPGVLIKRLTGARLSVTVHGLDVLYPKPWYQWMIRHFLPAADRVCAVSTATADAAARRGVLRERLVVIANGIRSGADDPVRVAHERGPMLITVGRLIPRKGVAWFIESVLPRLLQEFPALQYHVVGGGPEAEEIRRIAVRLHLAQHLRLHGVVDDRERDALLLQSDVFVMPNVEIAGDMEGFGIVCIEAGNLGVPVAASRLQGITDAVREGETGKFFTPGDAADCARVIGGLLHHPMPAEDVRRSTERHFNEAELFRTYRDTVFSVHS
ncbi:MAG TPA: glycosyltransferase family 4 protein [Candidatus Peribacteraceae bacterium]|nr:glycosyltransferase family 4 protein [Candidatus Peribacteraceae bacterium]